MQFIDMVSGHRIFEVKYLKNCVLWTKLLQNMNRKSYTIY